MLQIHFYPLLPTRFVHFGISCDINKVQLGDGAHPNRPLTG